MEDKFDIFIKYQEREVQSAKKRLITAADQVRVRCEQIIREASREQPIINELGELQSQATQVEAACGRLNATQQALKDAKAFQAS